MRLKDHQQAMQLGKALSAAAEADLNTRNKKKLKTLTKDWARENVLYVAVVDRHGEIAAHYGRIRTWMPLTLFPVRTLIHRREGPNTIVVARPVLARGTTQTGGLAGGVRIVLDTRDTAVMLAGAKRRIWLTAVLIELLAIPLAYVLVWQVLLRPIRRLVRATGRLAAGDYSARTVLKGSDEIGQLGRAFDHMAGQISSTRNELLQHQDQLEHQVSVRTEELREKTRQLKESMEKLRTMAVTDALTGLANRRSFAEQLTRQFSQAVRYADDLSCCMIDLDHYKQFNDTLGHPMGDELLQKTAELIRDTMRSSDVAARYGGDEFVLLLPQTSSSEAYALIERLREKMTVHFQRSARLCIPLTLSAGIASRLSDFPASADALVAMADRALYRAKDLGKDRIVTFSDFRGEVDAPHLT